MTAPNAFFNLPETARLLVTGGDERIACDPATGLNKYGLPPVPEPGVPAYGSSTASAISQAGFMAAERLQAAPALDYAGELNRIRAALRVMAGAPDIDIILSDSGTTSHLQAAQLLAQARPAPLSVIMMAAAETGRGVPAALGGRHFGQSMPLGGHVMAGDIIGPGCGLPTAAIAIRDEDGTPRPIADIDAEVMALVETMRASGHHILLNTVDCSKTGMIAPSVHCAMDLKQRFPGQVDVLVDGCQYRLSPATLRFYLAQGFIVALTGSKFMAGPSFSGALLIPAALGKAMRACALPAPLAGYSARAEWPEGWTARDALPDRTNTGLLLRWEAALVEMRAFHALPGAAVREFFISFAAAIHEKLASTLFFEPLPVPAITRGPLSEPSWDTVQTIFPFLPRRSTGVFLTRDETRRLYETIGRGPGDRARLGQPVECGARLGVPVSALRLCLSAPLAADVVSPQGRGAEKVIAEALSVLDNVAARADMI